MRTSLILIALFYSGTALAVLPPKIARERKRSIHATAQALQKTAPEVLVIKVLGVRVKPEYYVHRYSSGKTRKILRRQELRVDARILRVVRSKRRLRHGQRIRFTYAQRFVYQPGPRIYNPRGLAKGARAQVYLRYRRTTPAKRGRYHLAASILSVTNVKSGKRP